MIWGNNKLEAEVISLRAEVSHLRGLVDKLFNLSLEAVVGLRAIKESTHRVVVTSEGDISKLEKQLSVIPGMTNEDFETDLKNLGMDMGENPEELV